MKTFLRILAMIFLLAGVFLIIYIDISSGINFFAFNRNWDVFVYAITNQGFLLTIAILSCVVGLITSFISE